ncbi:MAG TPA: YwiC-like family protein [Anaeromyxobacteraceae bacterium]|nr:YwiC-like family protein [Anaeromyxobacteraceae bacterium]
MPTPTPPPERGSARALVPHEHGAYGQLALPLATALALGRPTLASGALALTVVLLFLAHEPLLVVLGQRGRRARAADGPRARRLLSRLLGAAALSGIAGCALAPAPARLALLPPLALGVLVATLLAKGREKTLLGEVAIGIALSSGALAVALCGGVSPPKALAAWGVWSVSFTTATLAVRAVLARGRSKGRRDPGTARAVAVAALALLAFAALALAGLPRAAALALVPTPLLSLVVCLARPAPKRLRALGWAVVGAGLVTLALIVLALRT